MKYPIVIAIGDEKTACDVRIPDLDVYTAADDFEDCYDVAIEAAEIELENKQRAGQEIPMPSQIEVIAKNPEYQGFHVSLIDIDIMPYLGKTKKSVTSMNQNI